MPSIMAKVNLIVLQGTPTSTIDNKLTLDQPTVIQCVSDRKSADQITLPILSPSWLTRASSHAKELLSIAGVRLDKQLVIETVKILRRSSLSRQGQARVYPTCRAPLRREQVKTSEKINGQCLHIAGAETASDTLSNA